MPASSDAPSVTAILVKLERLMGVASSVAKLPGGITPVRSLEQLILQKNAVFRWCETATINSDSGILPLALGRRRKGVTFPLRSRPAAAGMSLCLQGYWPGDAAQVNEGM